jgi:hypothetical protein
MGIGPPPWEMETTGARLGVVMFAVASGVVSFEVEKGA